MPLYNIKLIQKSCKTRIKEDAVTLRGNINYEDADV